MDGALIGRGWPVVMVTYGSGGPVNADDWDKEEHHELIGHGRGSIYDSIPRYSKMTGKVTEGAIKGRFLDMGFSFQINFISGILVGDCAVGDSTAFAVLCVCGYKCWLWVYFPTSPCMA